MIPYPRTQYLGTIDGLAQQCPEHISLQMWQRMCRSRYFDLECDKAVREKKVTACVYLSTGQESISAAVASSFQPSQPLVFIQHRGQAIYLAFDGDPVSIIDELLGKETGCCKGMGGAPFFQDRARNIYGHDCLLGSHVPIAVGAAYASQHSDTPSLQHSPVVCFLGDGAVEEDYMYGALGFAATNKLSILFVVEDNDLSVLTPTRDRRTWQIADVANAMGVAAVDITDDPWLVRHHTISLLPKLPALINVRTCREFWHAGAGCDGPPEWNRFAFTKKTLFDLRLDSIADDIELMEGEKMKHLWEERML